MRSTFKILFYINKKKIKADGKTAIHCRITIDGRVPPLPQARNANPPSGTAGKD